MIHFDPWQFTGLLSWFGLVALGELNPKLIWVGPITIYGLSRFENLIKNYVADTMLASALIESGSVASFWPSFSVSLLVWFSDHIWFPPCFRDNPHVPYDFHMMMFSNFHLLKFGINFEKSESCRVDENFPNQYSQKFQKVFRKFLPFGSYFLTRSHGSV